MGRALKITSMTSKHLTNSEKSKREYAESLIKTGQNDIKNVPTSLLIDSTARKEYKRILSEIEKMKLDVIGNLDRGNMIIYCNAYATYVRCGKEMKKKDFKMTVTSDNGMVKPNPIYQIQEQARKQMESAGKNLGMSVSSRLQMAQKKQKDEEEELTQAFGAI